MSEEHLSEPRAAALRPRSRPSVSLGELVGSDSAVTVRGITADSRLVEPGDLYVALPGAARHGAAFVPQALEAGAAAILTDAAGREMIAQAGVPVVVVGDPRRDMAGIAAQIYGCPADALSIFAVTGTNGKTTTTFLLDAALRASGHRAGIIGTIGFFSDGRPLPTPRNTVTTPESPELHAVLARLREAGADSVAMEVSSHGLALGRVDSIRFDVAAFTNFGRDHLDFHSDEESYFEAKASLFSPTRTRHAVINLDDPRCRTLVKRIGGAIPVTTVSLDNPSADCWASAVEPEPSGEARVTARLGGRKYHFRLNLPGDFNVRNALTALAMLAAVGVDVEAAATGLATARVPGRMQRVDLGAGAPLLYVDFAHTPQAVAAALDSLPADRRIVVLGCGGDRDPDKRRPMGAAAAAGADVVIITDDNPRSEEPAAIRAELMAGAEAARQAGRSQVELIDGGDRRAAIRLALEHAGARDAIALLGKGHESGQEIGGQVLPFDDAIVAAEEWTGLQGRGLP